MKQKSLLDSYGFLLYLQKEGAYQVIKSLFRDAQNEENPILINELSIGEIFHVTARKHSLEKAEAFLPLLEILPMEIVSNTLEDILRAAKIKAQYSIGYVRALIAATAEREKALLVTGDRAFEKVEGIVPIKWLE